MGYREVSVYEVLARRVSNYYYTNKHSSGVSRCDTTTKILREGFKNKRQKSGKTQHCPFIPSREALPPSGPGDPGAPPTAPRGSSGAGGEPSSGEGTLGSRGQPGTTPRDARGDPRSRSYPPARPVSPRIPPPEAALSLPRGSRLRSPRRAGRMQTAAPR